MALGRQQKQLRAYVAPIDEVPDAVPAQADPVERRQNGQVASAEAAAKLGRRGGLARAERKRQAEAWGSHMGLGRYLTTLGANEHLAPFIAEGEAWREATSTDLAATVGGGRLGPAVLSMIASATWQRVYGRYFMNCAATNVWGFDRDEDAKPTVRPNTELVAVASRLLDGSRQNCIAAFEIASREAQARPRETSIDSLRVSLLGGKS